MAVTTTAPADVLTERIRREFIPFLRNKLVIADHATEGSLEGNAGHKTLRWVMFNKLTADATTALPEANVASGEIVTLSVVTVTTTIAEYGAWAKISSLADVAATKETRDQYSKGFAEHGARTIDTLMRNLVTGATGGTYLIAGQTAKNTGTLATTGTATAQDVAVISGIFHINDAEEFDNGYYVVVVHGEVEQDIVTDVTTTRLSWSEVNKHVPGMDGQQKIIRGTPGAIYGTMVLRSNLITTAVLTNTVTAYMNVALADYGIGRASFKGMTPRGAKSVGPNIIIKNSGNEDTSNPLSMFGTLGWKAAQGQALLDVNRALVFYSVK